MYLQVSHRVALLSVNKVGEMNWVADEENWRGIANKIPVAFLQ